MNKAQKQYAASLKDKTPVEIAITLADALGYLIWEREMLEENARQGTSYAEVEKREREEWQAAHDADPEIMEPFNDCKTSKADFLRICRETRAADALVGELPHVDIGIRPLLALAVKQCPTAAKAEEIVRLFYGTFNESASK